MNYEDLKNKILALIDGHVTVTVKIADLDLQFAKDVMTAKFRFRLSKEDRITITWLRSDDSLKFSMI